MVGFFNVVRDNIIYFSDTTSGWFCIKFSGGYTEHMGPGGKGKKTELKQNQNPGWLLTSVSFPY